MAYTGRQINNYIFHEKLAVGGMAEIWLASTRMGEGLDRFVAIKMIREDMLADAELIQMFRKEALVSMNLSHANIASIYEVFNHNGNTFIVMDFLEGQNLKQVVRDLKLKNLQLSLPYVLYIIREVAAGIDYAHQAIDKRTGQPLKIVHRDVSPSNIMLLFSGGISVIDFGVVKAETRFHQTEGRVLKGKYGYMSPEQVLAKDVDPRTDIFSLGVVLWELVTGRYLFADENTFQALDNVKNAEIPDIQNEVTDLPKELLEILGKALQKERTNRYSTMGKMYTDLNQLLNSKYPDFSRQDLAEMMQDLLLRSSVPLSAGECFAR